MHNNTLSIVHLNSRPSSFIPIISPLFSHHFPMAKIGFSGASPRFHPLGALEAGADCRTLGALRPRGRAAWQRGAAGNAAGAELRRESGGAVPWVSEMFLDNSCIYLFIYLFNYLFIHLFIYFFIIYIYICVYLFLIIYLYT